MSDPRLLVVGPGAAGQRADAFVARALGVGTKEARELFARRAVRRQGRPLAKGDELAEGDELLVPALAPWLVAEGAPALSLAYVDDEVGVVDKPAGMAPHPLARGEGGTVADGLFARFPEVETAAPDEREGGLVHRLDPGTSGLLAAARTSAAWRALRAAFTADKVARGYVALVHGALAAEALLEGAIAHDPGDARRMVVGEGRGQPRAASTEVRPVAQGECVTLVIARTRGGRRHQVRVHLAEAGHPLVGDPLYGGTEAPERAGHMLHAALLCLPARPRLLSRPGEDFLAVLRGHGLDEAALKAALAGLSSSVLP
jgi:23S rRNA pseudouridine1911/1915/1917 synthase